jgi:hypothetical protein
MVVKGAGKEKRMEKVFFGVFEAKSCENTQFTFATSCIYILHIGLSACNTYKIDQHTFNTFYVVKFG